MTQRVAFATLFASLVLSCSSPNPDDGSGDVGAPELPCDVAAVLQQKCLLCHSAALGLRAPMQLVTYADTHADRNGQPVWKAMQAAVASGKMPAFGSLSAEQKATLEAWFEKEAPSGKACPPGTLGGGAETSGIAQLGDEDIYVPAATQGATITKRCTTLSKNGKPVTIVSAIPHTHFLGKNVITEHFRDGKSIGILGNFEPGTYDWQAYESKAYGRDYLPGDELVTTCYYDNPNAYAVGYPAEMCHNFLVVSPIAEANTACEDD